MNNIVDFSAVSAVTVASVGLALLIEMALLKVVFSCMARVRAEAASSDGTSPR